MDELTKRDISITKPDRERYFYGRGSKVIRKWMGSENPYTLIELHCDFWTAINPRGMLESLGLNDIDKVLVDRHWINFDPKRFKLVGKNGN